MYVNRGWGTGSGFNGQVKLSGVEPEALARVTVTGLTGLGQSTAERVQNPIQPQQFIDNLRWVKGNHSVKSGLESRRSSNIETNSRQRAALDRF